LKFAPNALSPWLMLALVAALGAPLSGCASSCDTKKVECRYECDREYKVCDLRGNDEFYCHNQAGLCYGNCDYDRATCKEPWYHVW
jgi:hypothetical protein